MSQTINTIKSLISIWENDDVEGVLALLHEQVIYHYLVGMPPLTGKEEVRAFLLKFGQGQTDKCWRITHYAENGDHLLVEGVDDYVNADGVRVQIPYMGIFEFKDGLIYRWRDYVNTSLLEKAKKGEAPPAFVQSLFE